MKNKEQYKFTDEDIKFGKNAYLFRVCLNFLVLMSVSD